MSNIQVVVRCRERNPREVKAKSQVIVNLPDQYSISQPTITINSSQNNQLSEKIIKSAESKTYTFDQVYGPLATQELLFSKAVDPIFKEFLLGFNVTVLAYGQTGTGKTYTMCGKSNTSFVDEDSGIIPRILQQLFESLDKTDDYVIKCSFIELYNENLKDLLNDDEDTHGFNNNNRQSLKIFEDKTGNSSSILIQNLKQVNINNLHAGFNLLQKGLHKRKVASTNLNDFSSRSHTIFTINLYRKDPQTNIIKHSKINLVDLAGSENVSKSGSINQRAKEAGSINQSLLTLGRVINSLSEKSNINLSHIPYRESKLTRLLQDSIGGKTKTLLISTISPAKINLEETLSTLDYSLKVKNIENKPQLGQDFDIIMKQVMVKDLSNEIIKLNNDLIATRSKNGIYMDQNNYDSLIEENLSNKNQLKELQMKINQLESKVESLETNLKDRDESDLKNQQEIEGWKTQHGELDLRLSKLNDNISLSVELLLKLKNNELIVETNSKESIELIKSVSNQLNLIKSNFNGNFDQISKDIDKSLTELPTTLNDLMKQLNNDDCFNDFKNKQNDFNSQLKLLNTQFHDYLREYKNKLNIPEIVENLFNEKLDKEVEDIKQLLVSNINNQIQENYTRLTNTYKTSINEFSNDLLTNKFKEITQESKKWSHESNDIYKRITGNISDYHNNMMNSNNINQDKLNKASTNIRTSLKNSLTPALLRFSTVFTNDTNEVINQLPRFNQLAESNIQQVVSNNQEIEGIHMALGSVKRSPLKVNDSRMNRGQSPDKFVSPIKLEKSPIKLTKSPVKLSKSPEKVPHKFRKLNSQIPTIREDLNLKKRKYNNV